MSLITLMLVALAVERATELLHSAKIFLPLRNWLAKVGYRTHHAGMEAQPINPDLGSRLALFAYEMLSCGYCASVWVAMLAACLVMLPAECYQVLSLTPGWLCDWVLKVLVLHGGANLCHVLYERLRKGRVNTHDVQLSATIFYNRTVEQPGGQDNV